MSLRSDVLLSLSEAVAGVWWELSSGSSVVRFGLFHNGIGDKGAKDMAMSLKEIDRAVLIAIIACHAHRLVASLGFTAPISPTLADA